MPSSPAERKRKQRQRDRENPDRKCKKLDTIYMFGEVDVSVIIDDHENIWFKGVDLARALEMKSPNVSVCELIDKKYCKSYEDLTMNSIRSRYIPNIHPNTTFVNKTGMNMFVLRSRKPKAEVFAEWVCGEVLPSIRKTNRQEIQPEDNPYRILNEYMQKRIEDLTVHLRKSETEKSELKTDLRQRETEKSELINDLRKRTDQLFDMKASFVPKLNNEAKREYFVLYRKYKKDTVPHYESMPYYACRVQLDSLEQRYKELLKEYPQLEKMLQLLVPNSVVFFNYILEQMSEFLERGGGNCRQSFRITKNSLNESQMVTMIENLYRTLHGRPSTTK